MYKHGFTIRETRHVEEINADVSIYSHNKSGARLIHIDADDDNKVFAVGFRTPPTDDTGVAHIMEHSVLCGSKKYPTKEPFVELLKGSLNTFLNAMTASDYTLYPIASMNDKDFKNLMEVYLDAVFFPNIYQDEKILQQEGWHYEINPDSQELEISGVVYNEMKGAYSSPMRNMFRALINGLYPDSPYRFESGGVPDAIPQLTQDDFIKFHKEHYHPANSYIYLYGKLDLDAHLKIIDQEALSHFDAIDIDTAIPEQELFEMPVRQEIEYPISSDENEQDKHWYGIQYLVDTKNSAEINFSFEVISHLLLDTPAAPLKNAILKAGIGKDVMGHFDSSSKQPTFTIFVKDAKENKLQEFEAIIDNTLKHLCDKGIDKNLIEASINIKEFILREADFSGFPKGLFYIFNSMSSWIQDYDPVLPLQYEERLTEVKQALTTNYFESLINHFILNNMHRSIVTMKPKKGLTELNNANLRKDLQKIKEELSDAKLNEIGQIAKALKEKQQRPDKQEDLEKIPLLSLQDINKEAKSYETIMEQFGPSNYLYHPLFTNGIAYVRYHFDTKTVKQDDVQYISLLSSLLGAISTNKRNYADLSNLINIHTGGIRFALSVFGDKDDMNSYQPKLAIKAKVLMSKLNKLIEIISEIILDTDFDDYERILEIINQEKSSKELGIINAGSSYAAMRLDAYYSQGGAYVENIAGVDYYFFLKRLAKEFEHEKENISAKLKEVANKIFNTNNLHISFTAPEEDFVQFKKLNVNLVEKLCSDKHKTHNYSFKLIEENEAFLTPGKVQYVCKGYNFRALGYDYNGSMRVMRTIARLDYLWNNIRVLGGAYGAHFSLSFAGTLYAGSYRDPNLKESLIIYDKIADFLQNLDINNRELTKYILGTISDFDQPETPATTGDNADRYYFSNISNKFLQQNRDEILATQLEDIKNLAPVLNDVMNKNRYCVFGSEGKIKENLDLFQTVISVFD
ncbi:MAG: insulinase family protein [Candidatus Cloacimonadales bacterium]|jgi:Zn-dependent M16 (insulinase) family peptidase|nr:insulinase family protein [Candidatus Cloacimonadales bacterium]